MLILKSARLLPTVVLCGLLLAATGTPAAAETQPGYLALGDSVPFGFNPLVDPRNVANFSGYPEALAARLGLNLTNASCPGEASGGFISLTGVDNLCRPYRFVFDLPLHVNYSTSQLDFAVAFLKAHPDTRLVTLTIGANDLFILQAQCNQNTLCVLNGLPAMLKTLAANLTTIYGRIRGEAHYRHQIIALTYYAIDYRDPVGVPIIGAIDETLAQTTRAVGCGNIADGFDAFKVIAERKAGGDSCAAGLLIVLPTNPVTCDIHPSTLGRDVLAKAVAVVVHGLDDRDANAD